MSTVAEGAVRLVYYSYAPGVAVTRRVADAATLAGAVELANKPLRSGAFRVDVEQVIEGHWSLIGRRTPSYRYQTIH